MSANSSNTITIVACVAVAGSCAALFSLLLVLPSLYSEITSLEQDVIRDVGHFKERANILWAGLRRVQQDSHRVMSIPVPVANSFSFADHLRPKRQAGRCNCDRNNRCPPGPQGAPGPQGYSGEEGRPGDQGQPGKDAFKATFGEEKCILCPAGRPGPAGPRGNPGGAGRKGPPGQPGARSAPGRPGSPGLPGDQGSRGQPGRPGPGGPPGNNIVTGSGRPGPRGPNGRPGPAGDSGRPGRDFSGAGPSGPPGIPGDRGGNGNPGSPGSPGRLGFPGLPGSDAQYCPCPPRSSAVVSGYAKQKFVQKS